MEVRVEGDEGMSRVSVAERRFFRPRCTRASGRGPSCSSVRWRVLNSITLIPVVGLLLAASNLVEYLRKFKECWAEQRRARDR